MGYSIGTILKGGGDDAHQQLLGVIKTLMEANGWTTLRFVNTGINRELIVSSQGLSGTEQIYAGFRTYQNITADWYNLAIAAFTGYVSGNTFDGQPGARICSLSAHNNAITHFITCNAQRIALCLKVGTPVYVHGMVGKFFPFARPSEYPSPLMVAGMRDGYYNGRYSDTAQNMPYFGYLPSTLNNGGQGNLYLRTQAGNWVQRWHYPFANGNTHSKSLTLDRCLVAGNGNYQMEPIIMYQYDNINRSNVLGQIDGVFHCSGFNNGVENVMQMGGSSIVDQTGMTVLEAVDAIKAVGGRAFVVLQNYTYTHWYDYIGMEM